MNARQEAAALIEKALYEAKAVLAADRGEPDVGIVTGFVLAYSLEGADPDMVFYGYLSLNASQPRHVSAGLLHEALRFVYEDD